MVLNFEHIQTSHIIKLTHQLLCWGKRISTHSVLFTNGNSCLFQLEIYSLLCVVWGDHYLFPLFLCECQVLLLHHLNRSVPIQSCKAEKQFLCVSFHSADWRSKYPWRVFTFSKLWMNRTNVAMQWHFVYLHSPNILCINWSIFMKLVKIPYAFKWHTTSVLLKFLHVQMKANMGLTWDLRKQNYCHLLQYLDTSLKNTVQSIQVHITVFFP